MTATGPLIINIPRLLAQPFYADKTQPLFGKTEKAERAASTGEMLEHKLSGRVLVFLDLRYTWLCLP
jgi:hypothetical protein